MEPREAREIIACLPKSRTLFPYFRDRYAVLLLQRAAGEGKSIAELKRSRFAKLLDRPAIRDVVARRGSGRLSRRDLEFCYQEDAGVYVLTLDTWGHRKARGASYQVTRAGANLVLQVNFTRFHDVTYRRLLRPVCESPFSYAGHPICRRERTTMAWVRIDLGPGWSEALIEEVQNDWIRRAMSSYRYAATLRSRLGGAAAWQWLYQRGELVGPLPALEEYVEMCLKPHVGQWAEAALAAAIWFVAEEIGVRRIWFHEFETGARLKQITGKLPPRSIYTDLPKRFCFERTREVPEFVLRDLQKRQRRFLRGPEPHFWCLDL